MIFVGGRVYAPGHPGATAVVTEGDSDPLVAAMTRPAVSARALKLIVMVGCSDRLRRAMYTYQTGKACGIGLPMQEQGRPCSGLGL